ncbi:kinase-like domain-containing protein [Suillus subalutaceus]|uniref:kinase-like domain-containing protein n=1 Tax=Suillus subalutaceus TaxID=48586 RepID=UPI001B86AE55|nr:kinase-like domain-containing protein [Suillus subalutaceus]KAG1853444.1 kinase-like domain-containing protein [Suillus subalutaceus]
MGDLPPESVQFKIEPSHIPATNIVAAKSIRVLSTTDAKILKEIGKRIRREAYIWILLEHDHILPLEGVTVAEEFGPLPALVSPWMEEGSLDDYLKREFSGMSDPRKRELVAAGISYRALLTDVAIAPFTKDYPLVHGKGIVHGDLTATNVLVDSSGCLRLADFGLSMVLAEAGNATFNSCHPGNVRWMPPEALRDGDEDEDEAKDEKPTKAWDVYSYGCVVLQVFSGNQPYAWITSVLAVMGAMQKGRVPFKPEGIQSLGVYQQFSPCLNRISADRPTIDDIMRDLGLQ